MDNQPHSYFPLSDRSYASIVKKDIKRIAEEIGFVKTRLGEIEIIIAEITSNLIKHSKDGYVLAKRCSYNDQKGIEIISIDKGPGFGNAQHMMKDGVSTVNTLGQGLGAIKRLSDEFDLYSSKGWGTILLSRVFLNKPESINKGFRINVVMVPKKGEILCGDGYKFIAKKNTFRLLTLDGLGHGPEAHKASEAAIKFFTSSSDIDPGELLKTMNKEIKNTRGAVGMIFNIDSKNNLISYCGVGNISARLLSEGKFKSCISYNGIIGHSFPNTLHSNSAEWNKGDCLIVASDGLNTRWEAQFVTNLMKHDPTVIAAALFKEFGRGTDDSLVIIVK